MRRHCLEVFYGFCVDVDCDLLLQPFRIWVLLGSAEIIFFSHVNHLIPIETDSAKHRGRQTGSYPSEFFLTNKRYPETIAIPTGSAPSVPAAK